MDGLLTGLGRLSILEIAGDGGQETGYSYSSDQKKFHKVADKTSTVLYFKTAIFYAAPVCPKGTAWSVSMIAARGAYATAYLLSGSSQKENLEKD
ncbi:MAG: hypothetical protein ACE5JC_06000 [Candidatus Zixiibacteriota bacterium]